MCVCVCFLQLDHCDLYNVSPVLAHKSFLCAQLLLTSPELKTWVLLTQNDITAEELTKRLDHFWHHCKPETTFSTPNLPLTKQIQVTVTQHILCDLKILSHPPPFSAAFRGIGAQRSHVSGAPLTSPWKLGSEEQECKDARVSRKRCFFWNSLAFSMMHQMLAIWSLVPLPFLKPAWISEVHGSLIAEAWLGEFWALLY